MKQIIHFVFAGLIVLGTNPAFSQDRFEPLPFQIGEQFKFSIEFGVFQAALATVSVKPTEKTFDGKSAYWISGRGETTGAFDFFIKIRNNYDSYVDAETLLPHLYVENVREGSYKRQGYLKFNRSDNTVTNKDSVFEVKPGVHDIISAFFHSRTVQLDTANNKDSIYVVNCFLGKEQFTVGFKFLGTKNIKTKWGLVNCMMFRPIIKSGVTFTENEDAILYVTNDYNRMPILAKVDLIVGSLELNLIDFGGLKHPMTSLRPN
ncbi:MAG: hypothetical protein ACI81S_000316 [Sphingobacteriales bacterium]|jgi:hypothetical protein